jgi:hypothetical protein
VNPTTMYVLHSPKKGQTWRGWEKCSGAVPGDLHRERMDLLDASTALLDLMNRTVNFCEPCSLCVKVGEPRDPKMCHEGTCPTTAGSHVVQLARAQTALAEASRALSDAQMKHHYNQVGGAGMLIYSTKQEAEKALKVVDPDGANYFVVWPIVVEVPDAGDALEDAKIDAEFNPHFREWLNASDYTAKDWVRGEYQNLNEVARTTFGLVDDLGFSVGDEKHWYWPNGELAGCVTRGHDGLSWNVTVQNDNGMVMYSNTTTTCDNACDWALIRLTRIGFKHTVVEGY